MASTLARLDFARLGALTFEEPDTKTFRGLDIAIEAGRAGGTAPCVMNAANEIAVAAFLAGSIGFLDIYDIIEQTMSARSVRPAESFEILQEEDAWARAYAARLLQSGK